MALITITVTRQSLLSCVATASSAEREHLLTILIRDCLSVPDESAALVRDQMCFDFWSGLLKVDNEEETPEVFAERLSAAWDEYFLPAPTTILQ